MLRGFTDTSGLEWRVWQVLPSIQGSNDVDNLTRLSLNGTPFAKGWLCFESEVEKRRLAPIPEGWEFLETGALAELCYRATIVPRRQHQSGAA